MIAACFIFSVTPPQTGFEIEFRGPFGVGSPTRIAARRSAADRLLFPVAAIRAQLQNSNG